MIGRAWAWLTSHAWVAFAALGALVVLVLEWLVRSRQGEITRVSAPDMAPVARDASRAEVHEGQAAVAATQVAEIQAEIVSADQELSDAEKRINAGLPSGDAELARVLSERMRAGDSR